MQLLESGFFDNAGFTHLHVAGHPEGNRDIDPDGGEAEVMAALRWKQDFAEPHRRVLRHRHAIRLRGGRRHGLGRAAGRRGHRDAGASGRRGPAKLQTLIKFAIACGVGKSLGVLQKRAKDVTKLLMPFEPTEFWPIWPRARPPAQAPNIERIHFFPLGGIKANAEWAMTHGGAAAQPAAAASVA
jgi:methylenetetrahydrofolate reductase (NADPH)